jgi:chromosomal replication initiator protein
MQRCRDGPAPSPADGRGGLTRGERQPRTFKITIDALHSHVRTQPLVRRQQLAMYVARQVTGRSLPFIGKKMGGRDHSTILHGVRTVQALIDAGDAATVEAVDAITSRLNVAGGAHV